MWRVGSDQLRREHTSTELRCASLFVLATSDAICIITQSVTLSLSFYRKENIFSRIKYFGFCPFFLRSTNTTRICIQTPADLNKCCQFWLKPNCLLWLFTRLQLCTMKNGVIWMIQWEQCEFVSQVWDEKWVKTNKISYVNLACTQLLSGKE